MKQNLVKFKHFSHEIRRYIILVTLNGTEDANLWLFSKKMLVFYNFLWILVKKVKFWKEFPLSSMKNSKFMRLFQVYLFFVMEFLYSS